jgi:prepilin-type N-terminal cleavage/methylation domain-containing protein
MKKNGFTLVELLIVIVLGALVMAAIYGVLISAQRTSAGIGRRVITQQDARAVLDFMASEIRMASYNPTMQMATWSAIPICNLGGASPVTSRKGIQIATANSILISMDLDQPPNPPDGAANDVNENILYTYNSANNVITRSVSCGPNNALLGGTAPGTRVINNEEGIALFQYFDRDGNAIAAPVSNANIPAIRRIRINIAAETEHTDPSTGRRKRMIYSTDVLVRNHVFNINF